MKEELKPCPFCGAGETQLIPANHWTGMQNVVLSVTVRHWCKRDDNWPQGHLDIKGNTEAEAIAAWNRRASPSAGQWIAVTERLPDHHRAVLVWRHKDEVIDRAWCDGELWHSLNGFQVKCTHWMPLPAPPLSDIKGEK